MLVLQLQYKRKNKDHTHRPFVHCIQMKNTSIKKKKIGRLHSRLETEHYLLHVSLSGRNATRRNMELIYSHSFPLAREREKMGRTWERICRWWVCLGYARECPKSVAQGLGRTESVNSDRLLFTELDGKNHQCFKIYTAKGVWNKWASLIQANPKITTILQ